ncbi:MAG: hypothetical protein OHK0023_17830 [Anaerolineae bacterium]
MFGVLLISNGSKIKGDTYWLGLAFDAALKRQGTIACQSITVNLSGLTDGWCAGKMQRCM